MAAIIFTDVARSTELLYELGPERYEGVRRRHVAHLRAALHEQGGREVKSLGDGLMAIVPSAAGGVAAAAAMQQRTAAQAQAARIDLRIRIGVAAGDVVEDEGDYYGPAVVEAARLCPAATGGEILLTDLVRRLAGDRPGVGYEAVGPMVLKGIPEPVDVHRVVWSTSRDVEVGSPAMLSGRGAFELVGREAERAAMVQAWDRAAAGERQLVLLAGEPGIGKSRLAADVAGHVHAHGGTVLFGRCDPDGGGPLQPFVLALRQYLTDVLRDAPVELGGHAAALLTVVPELAERSPHLVAPEPSDDPVGDRLVLFDAVAEAFHEIAAGSPLLVVLDDVHWAAAQTVQLLRHLVGWHRDAPLMIVATYRPADVSTELAAVVADASRLDRCLYVAVEELDEGDVLDLLSKAAATDLSAVAEARELALTLREETGGNPLYVTQLLAHLVEAGHLQRVDGRWTRATPVGELRLPESLRDVVLGRISAVGDDVTRLLGLAAIAGARFDALVLEQIDDLDGRFLDVLERATRHRLVEQVGRTLEYRFIHALVRDVVYDELSTLRRARLHDRLAEQLAASPGCGAAMLAHHSLQSAMLGPAQQARAVRHARLAGDEADAAFEFETAARWYGVALEHLAETDAAGSDGEGVERAEILLRLGTAQRRAGIAAFRGSLLEASRIARNEGVVDLLVQATLTNTRGTFADSHGLDADRIEMLRAALTVIPPDDLVHQAELLCSLAMELSVGPGFDDRRRLSDDALELARRSGNQRTLAWVLARRQVAVAHVVTIAERARDVAELVDLAERLDDDLLGFRALHYSVKMALEVGDGPRVESDFARLEAHATSMRQPEPLVWVSRHRATIESIHGNFDAADREMMRSLDLARRVGAPDAALIFASQRFSFRFMQGRLGELAERMAARKGDGWFPAVWAHWSLLNAELGDLDEAADSLQRQHTIDFWDYPNGHVATSGIAAAVLAAARLGDGALVERALPVLDAADGFCIADACYWWGPVAHYQGIARAVLGDLDRAVEHLEAAIRLEHDLEAWPWLARSLAELVRVRRRRGASGDDRVGDEAATEALALAAKLDLAVIPALLETPLAV